MANNFINDCLITLGSNPFLWIAFQSNVLCDCADTSEEFKHQFQGMIEKLKSNKKNYAPHLNFNMRNSHEVGELAKNLESTISGNKVTNVIQTMETHHKSSLTSNKPKLIPIDLDNLHKQLENLISEATQNGYIPVILFQNTDEFNPIFCC